MQYYKESAEIGSEIFATSFTLTQSNEIMKASSGTKRRQFIDGKKRFFIMKRALDIILSLLVIVFVLSWLFPIIALIIRLESSGPLFFVQKRVGKGGRTFRCFKFRTMVVNNYANSHSAVNNDSRITSVGKFLRVSNLDEFPQFFNVLSGDMSIVGPRPHMHADCSKFSGIVPGYKFRNLVKPGITGLAQVKGYRGPTKSFNCVSHRYQFDAFYVKKANLWLDLGIISITAVQTITALITKLTTPADPRPFMQRKWVLVLRSLIN